MSNKGFSIVGSGAYKVKTQEINGVKFYPSLQQRASRCYPLFYLEASSWGNKWAPIKTSTHYLSHIQSSSFHCCVFLDLQHLSIWGAETENIRKITWHLFTSLPPSLSLSHLYMGTINPSNSEPGTDNTPKGQDWNLSSLEFPFFEIWDTTLRSATI